MNTKVVYKNINLALAQWLDLSYTSMDQYEKAVFREIGDIATEKNFKYLDSVKRRLENCLRKFNYTVYINGTEIHGECFGIDSEKAHENFVEYFLIRANGLRHFIKQFKIVVYEIQNT